MKSTVTFFVLALALVFVAIPFSADAAVTVYETQSKRDFLGPKVYPDQRAHGGFEETAAHGKPEYNGTQVSPTGQRICYLYDPTAYPTKWSLGGFDSPGNNKMAAWDPATGKWFRKSASSFQNSRYNYITCKTDAPPDTSLTASKINIARGESVTLSWKSEYGQIRQATCTAENFTTQVSGGGGSVVPVVECSGGGGSRPDWDIFTGMTQAASAGFGSCYRGVTTSGGGASNAPFGGSKLVSPTETTTYTYTCTNANGSTSKSVTVNVASTLAGECSVAPASASVGQQVTWTATATGGTGEYAYEWSGSDGLSGDAETVSKGYTTGGAKNASVTITSGNEVIEVDCENSASIGTDGSGQPDPTVVTDPSVTPNPDSPLTPTGPAPLPTVLLTVDDELIQEGETTRLRWETTNVLSCLGTNFSVGNLLQNLLGGLPISPKVTTDYTIDCKNRDDKHAYSSARVTVINAPVMTLTSDPERVRAGESITLAWAGGNSTSCSLIGPSLYRTSITGSERITIQNESTFTLTCTKSGYTYQRSLTVGILPVYGEE